MAVSTAVVLMAVSTAVVLMAVSTAHIIPIILWRTRVLLGRVVRLTSVVEFGFRVTDFRLIFAIDLDVHDDENAAED